MIKSDQLVITAIAVPLIIHTTVWIVGYHNNKLAYPVPFLNAVIALMIIGFWLVNELRVKQPFIEGREIVVLIFELLMAAFSIFTILSHPVSNGFKITNYIVFGIHFTILVAGLIFMLTFKINKLF